jgi:hypothetical protein
MKKTNILVSLVLVAALVGAGYLVKSNQETRSSASFANVEALFLPDSKSVEVDGEITTTLMIDSKGYQLTGADLKIKYDNQKLVLKGIEVLTKSNFGSGTPWLESSEEIVVSEIDEIGGWVNLVGTNLQKDAQLLPKGIVNIVKLNFVAKAEGVANVSLEENYQNMVSGYNAEGFDQELKIEKVSGAIYKVLTTRPEVVSPTALKCGWCGSSCIDLNKKGSNMVCPMIYVEGKECVNRNGVCSIVATGPTVVQPEGIKCVLCGNECIDSRLISSTTVCPKVQTSATQERICVNAGTTGCRMLIKTIEVGVTE